MAKNTPYKGVVVKEDSKTSLRSAKIHPLTLQNGMRIVALGHIYYPYHDRSLVEQVLQYLRDTKPEVVLLMGGIVSEDAFRSLTDTEDNYLHDHPEVPEVLEAQQAGSFEEQVLALGATCGNFVKSIAQASGGTVIYVPSWTHLSMPNEVRLMEYIQFKKRLLDHWSSNHAEADETPSDPDIRLPKDLAELLGLTNLPNIKVTRYGAGIKVNGKTLFMIGDFRRRNAGDASKIEWEQRGISIVRAFDGKVASMWFTKAKHTQPGLRLQHWQAHEIGYLWDPIHMAHYRDYDRRAPGFWSGRIVHGHVMGKSIYVLRGNDGRRSFVVNGKPYTEEEAGCTHCGEEIFLPNEHAVLGTAAAISSKKVSKGSKAKSCKPCQTGKAKAASRSKAKPAVKGSAKAKKKAAPKPKAKTKVRAKARRAPRRGK